MTRQIFKLGSQTQITPIKPLINPNPDGGKGKDEPAAPAPFPSGPMSMGSSAVGGGGAGGIDAALQQQQMGQALDESGKLIQDSQAKLQQAEQEHQQTQAELDSTKMQLQGMQQAHDLEKQQLTAQIEAAQQQGKLEANQARGEAQTIKQQAKAEIDAAKVQQKLHADASKMQQKIQMEAQKAQKDLQAAQQPEGVSPALQEQASRALKRVSRIGQGALKMAVHGAPSLAEATAPKPPGQAPQAGQVNAMPQTPVTSTGVGTAATSPQTNGPVAQNAPQPVTPPVPATPTQAPGGSQPANPAAAQPQGESPTMTAAKSQTVPQNLAGTYTQDQWSKMDLAHRGNAVMAASSDPEQQAKAIQWKQFDQRVLQAQKAYDGSIGKRLQNAADGNGEFDLFNANSNDPNMMGWQKALRHAGNFATDLFGGRRVAVNAARNMDVADRQEELGRQFGVGGNRFTNNAFTDWMSRMGVGTSGNLNRLGLAGRKAYNMMAYLGRTNAENDRAFNAVDREWNANERAMGAVNQSIDQNAMARQNYHQALQNEGIDYNTGINNALTMGGALALGLATYASGGLAGSGARALGLGAKGVVGTSLAGSALGDWGGSMLMPDAGQVQRGVQMNPYNRATGEFTYADGHAPNGYFTPGQQPMDDGSGWGFQPQASVKIASFRLLAKAATQGPGIGQGFMLNRNGYFSQHPNSPYRIANAADKANEYGGPGKNFLMNTVLPLATVAGGFFGLNLNPQVRPPQPSGIQTGMGASNPRMQLASMNLNQYGLPQQYPNQA